MTWKQAIQDFQAALALAATIDPAIAATTEEISALSGIASQVVSTISAQSGAPIDQVIAGLTPEAPIE